MDNPTFIETLAINILAALIGLSLPLIIQTIERLENKYGESVIPASFRNEKVYKAYFRMVWISLALTIYLPWAPPVNCNFPDVWLLANSAHILVWLSIAVSLVLLLFVTLKILLYQTPEDLLKSFADPDADKTVYKKQISAILRDQKLFEIFSSIYNYSMISGNVKLYLKCNDVFGGCIIMERGRKKYKNGAPVEYVWGIYNQINETIRICTRHYNSLLYPTLNAPHLAISTYFDSFGPSTLSVRTFKELWNNLIFLIGSDREDWFRGYWVFVSQYADYTIANRIIHLQRLQDETDREFDFRKNNYITEKLRICEMHHVLLAYLIYSGKSDWVEWCFRYSPSTLNTQLLLPGDINEILDELRKTENSKEGPIDFRYPFFREEGVRGGHIEMKFLSEFYILSLIRQEEAYRSGLRFSDPLPQEIAINSTDQIEIQSKINLLEKLRNEIYLQRDELSKFDISYYHSRRLQKKLKGYQESLREDLRQLSQQTPIDMEDLAAANRLLAEAYEKNKILTGINAEPQEGFEERSLHLEIRGSVSKEDYVWNSVNFFQSLVPAFIHGIMLETSKAYLRLFLLNSAWKTYRIDFDELRAAVNKLGIDKENSDYVILPVNTWKEEGIPNMREPLNGTPRQEYLVIPEKELPAVKLETAPELEMEDRKGEGVRENIIFYHCKFSVKLSYPSSFHYIRLIMINSLFDGLTSQLKTIHRILTFASGELTSLTS